MGVDGLTEKIESMIRSNEVFNLSDIIEWMKSDDIEIRGRVEYILTERLIKIVPVPVLDEFFLFLLDYYEYCIFNIDTHEHDYIHPRYFAVMGLNQLFRSIHDNELPVKRKKVRSKDTGYYMNEIKALYRKMYLDTVEKGLDEIREYIDKIGLGHLFMVDYAIEFFADWKNDSQLRSAFDIGIDNGQDEYHRKIHNFD